MNFLTISDIVPAISSKVCKFPNVKFESDFKFDLELNLKVTDGRAKLETITINNKISVFTVRSIKGLASKFASLIYLRFIILTASEWSVLVGRAWVRSAREFEVLSLRWICIQIYLDTSTYDCRLHLILLLRVIIILKLITSLQWNAFLENILHVT